MHAWGARAVMHAWGGSVGHHLLEEAFVMYGFHPLKIFVAMHGDQEEGIKLGAAVHTSPSSALSGWPYRSYIAIGVQSGRPTLRRHAQVGVIGGRPTGSDAGDQSSRFTLFRALPGMHGVAKPEVRGHHAHEGSSWAIRPEGAMRKPRWRHNAMHGASPRACLCAPAAADGSAWLTADAGRAAGVTPLFGRDVFLIRTLIHSL